MKFYDNPIFATYRLPAATLSGGAAVLTRIQGPPGSRGMVVGLQTHVTTGVTVAAADLLLGVSGDTDKYGVFEVPVSAAAAVLSANRTQLEGIKWLEADTVVEIGTDGAATAGAADINLVVAWERKFPRP